MEVVERGKLEGSLGEGSMAGYLGYIAAIFSMRP